MSAIYYEFFLDWKEHRSNGRSFTQVLRGAISDVGIGREGAIFGASDGDFDNIRPRSRVSGSAWIE